MTAKRVFLTGGTGFIGSHLARHLLEKGWSVVLLTRDSRRVPHELQDAVRIVRGDLAVEGTGLRELADCDAVVHCASSDNDDPAERAASDVRGTIRLLDAASKTGVRRFVYLSSIAAYGSTPDGLVDETFPRKLPADLYGRTKLQIENEVMARANAFEVVILQPANVYGPGTNWWAQGILDLMRRGKVILVDHGEGTANLVHVSDVVQAIERALGVSPLNGESFLITDGRPVSWSAYYTGLEQILGRGAALPISAAEAQILCRKLQNRSLLARSGRSLRRILLGEPLIFPLSEHAIDVFSRKTVFSNTKARAGLGYIPRYDLGSGLQTVHKYWNATKYPFS
jgi:nucleoside-diphosphate-sugar epimerase